MGIRMLARGVGRAVFSSLLWQEPPLLFGASDAGTVPGSPWLSLRHLPAASAPGPWLGNEIPLQKAPDVHLVVGLRCNANGALAP